ncbi:hypothetical protein L2E82_49749 [Cichorium intybus]|uniref:Uncharacterized protein n=1 Tax=Cichorium intybus TaxID=13427 RepID=A0ACB8Z5A3_CICIN|nr:hypothetical protein L2E82_49749 [Cichorium intybus]
MNQPLWDELKNAPEDTRILQEMCEKNGKRKTPTPDTVRLTIKASEALLRRLPKKEKDRGSPLITATVGDVVIRNTLLDLGAMDFLVMEYESQEDAPALILGRPFLATAGAIIDCKTGDLDIFFGSRKRRLNMFGSPISLPQRYDDENLDSNLLMEPGIRDKSKIWSRTGEGGKEEVLKETKEHPLSTIDKDQLLDMMEKLEARHQQYEKDAREREAKVFQLLEAQQQWISGAICAPRVRKPTRCAGVDLGVRAPRFAHIHAAGIDRSVSFVNKMSFRLHHQFLQFPKGLDSSVEFASRRDALIGRRVLEATIIDRDILRDVGLWGEIEPFLHRTWTHGDASFTCRGWDRLMANQDDTLYTELLLEFLSTVRFSPGLTEARSRLVRFRLWGVPRECNHRDFGRRTGIYTEADLQHQHFAPFLRACVQGQPARDANAEVWTPLSNVFYRAGTSREIHLRDPLHRLMHRIVFTSIMHREGGEKVSGEDMM